MTRVETPRNIGFPGSSPGTVKSSGGELVRDVTTLARLFEPRSIAVVGASANPDKAGHQMLASLRGFPGELIAVHPHEKRILDVTCRPSLYADGAPIDLAVLTVPPAAVPGVLEDGAAAGLGAAVICAGGFAEAGPDGAALQDRIAGIAADAGIRILGPNTSGFCRPAGGVSAVFLPAVREFRPGGLAVVAQSGGVNLTVSFLAHRDGMGLRLCVGFGNGVDVGAADVLDYLAEDDGTEAVALHVEGVSDGRRLCDAIQRTVPAKPVLVLPVGRADVGRFAQSHTGALTGDFALTRSALRQAGAVVVDDTRQLVDAARGLIAGRARQSADPGVGLVTGQAGPGLLIADTLRSAGVSMPELGADARARVRELLPPITYQDNPVDTGRPGPTFGDVVHAVAADPAISAMAVFALDEPGAVDLGAALRPVAGTIPVVAASGGTAEATSRVRVAVEGAGIPVFDTPEQAARVLAAVASDARARWRLAQPRPALSGPATRTLGPNAVDEVGAKELMRALGFTTPDYRVCADRGAAAKALTDLGAPVVVKVVDPGVLHKTDVGGVRLGVRTEEDLAEALDAIDTIEAPARGHERRYLVERQAAPGTDLIIGAVRDASFGPVVLLGMGGTAAEALRLVAMRRAPLTAADASEMIADLPGAGMLDGYRGMPAADVEELSGALVRVGDLIETRAEISELDLNPVRVTAQGLVVLDALVVLGSDQPEAGE